ncbi:hypothetical protein [Pseudomonas trivialis]|uniref:Uncharacterized protein n=1 Tax=Pseudomonas trivialis TaxID=200450 RepID=A0A0H5AD05_9PSED|nr:hypothetical protein [Pseudomonas trivialis]AKS09019.1 hypothetical protein AA957_23820 [Pseudomonas trivialis]
MPLLVDRLPPVDYDDPVHAVPFVIAFSWGEQNNEVPDEVIVLTKIGKDTIVAATRQKTWSSYDEAVEVGRQAADKFVARYWQD